MGVLEWVIQNGGIYNALINLIVSVLNRTIDKNPSCAAVSDAIAEGKTLRDVIEAYVKSTPDLSDDDIPQIMDDILTSLHASIDDLRTKPLLDVILNIKIGGTKLSDVPLPDFDNDPSNNMNLGTIIKGILA